MGDVDLGTGYVQLQETLEKARWELERKDEHIRKALELMPDSCFASNMKSKAMERFSFGLAELEQALKPD